MNKHSIILRKVDLPGELVGCNDSLKVIIIIPVINN